MAEQKKKDFIEELTWRGMLHTSMPGIEDLFKEGMVTAYVGTDPTADSLHIGHLVSIMMLKHLQECRAQASHARRRSHRNDRRPFWKIRRA